MTYLVDERDVQFTLFEWLEIQKLNNYSAFSTLGQEEFNALLSEALKFAQRELAPLNQKSDEIGCKLQNGKVTTPPGFSELYQKYAQNGFIGMDVPTTYGGLNLPLSLMVACGEFFLGACFSFMMFPGLTRGAAHLIENFASTELAQIYCARMYQGEWAGTMCLTEPQAGSAVGEIKTSAKKTEEGYLISGNKIFISCGDHDLTSNIIHLVLARIEGDPEGTKGISLFVVPKFRVNPDGSLGEENDVKTVNIEKKMGLHASPTCLLAFGDNKRCLGYLVGEARKGMNYMFQLMNEARLMTGMQGVSATGNAYLHALQYSRERSQGGKTIFHYPDVKRMLATLKSFSEGMRGLLYKTALWIDQAHHEPDAEKKAFAQGMADLLTPVCKAFCSDKGFEMASLAMQIYGGYGYIQEYPIEQILRDVKISSIYEGANGIQALDLVGRKMASQGGELFRTFYEHLNTFCETHAKRATLEKEVESLKKALDSVGACAMKFAEIAMGGDRDYPQLHAVSFLHMVGYVCVAWVLLDQAILALPKLEKIWADANATVEETKFALCENNLDARYYEGKVKTARFYIAHILPQLQALAKSIQNEDRSALKIRF